MNDYFERFQKRIDAIIDSYPPDAIISVGGRKVFVCRGCGKLRYSDDGAHLRPIHPSELQAACNDQN